MSTYDGCVILGHPRSGTTLLRRLLNGHSRIACPGETHVLNASARFIRSQREFNGLDLGVLSGLSYAGFSEAEVLDKVRELALSFPRRFAEMRGKPRWLEKTALDAFYVPEISNLFGGQAYFVGMVRHPLDVALSCLDLTSAAGMFMEEFREFISATPYPIEAFARSWLKVAKDLMDFGQSHPNNFILCRYEDLISDTDNVLTEILDFIGEEFEERMGETGLSNLEDVGLSDFKSFTRSQISKDSIGRWSQMSPYEVGAMAELLNPTMALLGYEELPKTSDDGIDAARRRYTMRLLVSAKVADRGQG